MKKGNTQQKIPKTERQMLEGMELVRSHPFFGQLVTHEYQLSYDKTLPRDAAVVVASDGRIYFNKRADYAPRQWAWAMAHALLHRAFGHFDLEKVPGTEVPQKDGTVKKVANFDLDLWNTACDLYVNKFLADIHFGEKLHPVATPDIPGSRLTDELAIYQYLKERNWPVGDHGEGTASVGQRDMQGLESPLEYDPKRPLWAGGQYNVYAREFALALVHSVTHAVGMAAGLVGKENEKATDAQKAAAWFLNHYPLFGGMAAAFAIKENTLFCQQNEIQVAAVCAEEGEMYINPAAGLQHHKRIHGRDPYLWNVACDYVINGWLVEMGVGEMPDGCLYDSSFKNISAEEIYDRIILEARRYRKMSTLRGYGKGDVLGGKNRVPGGNRGVSLDDFFRSALMAGLEYQLEYGRGTIPAGMVQEIRALAMPPIRWDVQLAKWFDENILPLEKHRSYAHPSRRQSVTPDIPRPRFVWTEEERMAATFGVVIDTSGSMSVEMIGKALGSIASYAASKDVPAVRVVYCDASAFDAGYLPTEEIAGRVKVVGRGGTLLQPAIDLLEQAKDFPKDGPILIITDGWIEDHLTIHHKHAYLLPEGRFLPFRPKGEVFYFS